MGSHTSKPSHYYQASLFTVREKPGADMRKAALLLCVAAMVAFLAQPGQADSDENCKCLDITFNDGSTGRTIGACKSQDQDGHFWCYVEASSGCSDKKASARAHGLYTSVKPCVSNSFHRPGDK